MANVIVKILNGVGMWNIKNYSGVTIKFSVGNREIGLIDYYELCNCDNMENRLKVLNKQEEV